MSCLWRGYLDCPGCVAADADRSVRDTWLTPLTGISSSALHCQPESVILEPVLHISPLRATFGTAPERMQGRTTGDHGHGNMPMAETASQILPRLAGSRR